MATVWASLGRFRGPAKYWWLLGLDLFDDLLTVVAEALLRAARVAVVFPDLPVSAANAAQLMGDRLSAGTPLPAIGTATNH